MLSRGEYLKSVKPLVWKMVEVGDGGCGGAKKPTLITLP